MIKSSSPYCLLLTVLRWLNSCDNGLLKFCKKSLSFHGSVENKEREKSKECHNHKPQPYQDTKRKRKQTKQNKRKSNKRTKTLRLALFSPTEVIAMLKGLQNTQNNTRNCGPVMVPKKVKEKSRECHNHKPQPFPDTKMKRKQTKSNKRKSNKRTKSTKH